MSRNREYPREGSTRQSKVWLQHPKNAPRCAVAGCDAAATHRVEIEVNWFRGDDATCRACPAHKGSLTELVAGYDRREAEAEARRTAARTPSPSPSGRNERTAS